MKNIKEQPMKFVYDVPFTMIDSSLILSEDLSIYQKMVYIVLCAYASNSDKTCYPSYQTIATKAGISRRKAIAVMNELIEMELVEKMEQLTKSGDNMSNIYKINLRPKKSSECYALPNAQPAPPSESPALPSAQRAPELYSFNYNHFNYNQSVCQTAKGQDGQTDLHNIIETLKTETEYEYFELEMPDTIPFIDSLLTYIAELKIEDEPQNRKLLSSVNSLTIMDFLEHIKTKSYARVKNKKAYFKKMFIEYLCEDQILLATAH